MGMVVSMIEVRAQRLERTGFSAAVESGFGIGDDDWRKK